MARGAGATRHAPRSHALTLTAILLLALAFRLVNLDAYSGLFDEGIRVQQLFLMAWGYRPFREIFAAQGPLLLDSFYPFYALTSAVFGHSLVAARLVPVGYSLVGIAALAWLAWQIGGRWAALGAAFVLAMSPLYLEGSRLALAEVPALAPAIVAVAAATRYGLRGGFRWLLLAGACLTLSVLMKPITLAAVPAVCLGALMRGWPGWGNLGAALARPARLPDLLRAWTGLWQLALVGLAMLLLTGLLVFLLGFGGVWEQIFQYREAGRKAAGWSLRKNLAAIGRGFGFEPLALLPLAALGLVVTLVRRPRAALPGLVWAVGGVALLLLYSPLHGKHMVIAIPGLALLAGLAPALVSSTFNVQRSTWGRSAKPDTLNFEPGTLNFRRLAAFTLVLAYLASLPPVLARAGETLRVTADTDVDPAFEQYADAVAAIRALTSPDDFVVTDHPYLAFLAGRRVPPELVDASKSRIEARSLRASQAQAIAAAYDPPVVVLWTDRLRGLRAFKDWTEQRYRVVKLYNRRDDLDRLLYLRRDADFEAARRLLTGPPPASGVADFGGDLRLVQAGLERAELRPGDGATVTLHWQLLRPTSVDYHPVTYLRDETGQLWDEQEESLGGGSAGTAEWEPGRWVVQSSFVRAERDLAPGDYRVTVGLYNSRARAFAPVSQPGQPGATELEVARLTVTRR